MLMSRTVVPAESAYLSSTCDGMYAAVSHRPVLQAVRVDFFRVNLMSNVRQLVGLVDRADALQ